MTTLARWAPTTRHGAENGAVTSATIGDGEGGRTSVATGDADLDAVVAGLRSAFERARAPMAVSTPAGEYVAANDAYCTLTGHSLEALEHIPRTTPTFRAASTTSMTTLDRGSACRRSPTTWARNARRSPARGTIYLDG